LLLQPLIPSKKTPSPPPNIYSPKPPTSSSCYSSCTPTPPLSMPHALRFSLFPLQRSPSVSLQPLKSPSLSSSFPPTHTMRSQSISSAARCTGALSTYGPPYHATLPARFSSEAQPPNFSTTTYLQTSPLTTAMFEMGTRPESLQDLTSPMGAAIKNYFNSAESDDHLRPSALPPSSLQQQPNQHVLSPKKSTRVLSSLPTSCKASIGHRPL
jgi:hypothetical protein